MERSDGSISDYMRYKKKDLAQIEESGLDDCNTDESISRCEESEMIKELILFIINLFWKQSQEDLSETSSKDERITQDDIWEMWKATQEPPDGEKRIQREGTILEDDIGYNKCHESAEQILGSNARIYAASCRGRAHARNGKFRDDSFAIRHLEESGWYILAVADGAGSARYSRKGAQLACSISVDKIERHLVNDSSVFAGDFLDACNSIYILNNPSPQDIASFSIKYLYNILADAAITAKRAIAKEAHLMNEPDRNVAERDFNTTLLLALCKQLDNGQWFIGSFGIGDGAIALYSPKETKIMNYPDGGEYAGETKFLTTSSVWDVSNDSTKIIRRFDAKLVDDFTALFLMTDGVSDPIFHTDTNLNATEHWDKFWELLVHGNENDFPRSNNIFDENEPSKKLLDWLSFKIPGYHDDRTIIAFLPQKTTANNNLKNDSSYDSNAE